MEKKKAKIIIVEMPAEMKVTREEIKKIRGGKKSYWTCWAIPGPATPYTMDVACYNRKTGEWEFY